MSSKKTNNNTLALTTAADAMAEHDQVLQFFQAALTQPELALSTGEKQGLFTVMEWQRDSLREMGRKLLAERDND